MDWLISMASELKDLVRQTLTLNARMYGEILKVQTFMEFYLHRGLWIASEEPWFLEDCLGRVSPVHKQFIISWEAFQSVLEHRFIGLPGRGKIKRREYLIEESTSGRSLDLDKPWESAFVSGRRYCMSMAFDEPEQEYSAGASCPNCGAVSVEKPDTQITW
jgi:hypothetical protein